MLAVCLPIGFVALIAGVWACKASRWQWISKTGLVINGIALVPIVVLAMIYVADSPPIRQLTETDWLGLWLDLWMLFWFILMGCLIMAVFCMVATVVSIIRNRAAGGAITRIVHSLLGIAQVFTAFMCLGDTIAQI